MSGPVLKFSPSEKVAILLISLGEELAADILRGLPTDDVSRIVHATAKLGRIEQGVVERIQDEFQQLLLASPKTMMGGRNIAATFLQRAFGDKSPIAERDLGDVKPKAFFDAEQIDGKTIYQILSKERPQTTAIILANLSAKKAGECLVFFDALLKSEILLRMATLDDVERDVLEDLASSFGASLEAFRRKSSTRIGGSDKTAAILATLSGSMREDLLQKMALTDPSIVEAIKSQLWTFEDLARLDTSDIERLLRQVQAQDLELALRKASDTLRARIFRAVSARRAEELKENIAVAKPVPLAKVEDAQKRIAILALELIAKGDLRDPSEKAV